MRPDKLLIGAVASLGLLPVFAQPYPVTPLVLEGDLVPSVGSVTSINNLAVNDLGDWIVEVDTDNANTDTDAVLLLNGGLHYREGQLLGAPLGATLDGFDSVNLTVDLDSGWNFFLAGLPAGSDSGIYFNDSLLIQEGSISTAAGFSPGTPYVGFFEAKLNGSNKMLVVASVDDPAVASSVDRALLRLQLSPGGLLLEETVLAKESDMLPGQLEPVQDIGTGPHQTSINRAGQILYFADMSGPTDRDGTIYLDTTLIAQERLPSPVPGRNYELLSGRGLNVNRYGAAVFKANLDGTTTDDELIVRDGAAFIREQGSLDAVSPFVFSSFGISSGPVWIDDSGNLLWFGDWNDPDTDFDTGLFLNGLMLAQEGVTLVGGQPIDSFFSGADGFALSDNGRFAVFEATLDDGTNGAFMIEITPPPSVPNGAGLPGTPMRVAKNGADLDVSWDSASCSGDDYHLLYGDLADAPGYFYSGAACGLGSGGSATFTPPAGDLFWVVVASDDNGVEGSHGVDSDNLQRDASADGLCGFTLQIRGSGCP